MKKSNAPATPEAPAIDRAELEKATKKLTRKLERAGRDSRMWFNLHEERKQEVHHARELLTEEQKINAAQERTIRLQEKIIEQQEKIINEQKKIIIALENNSTAANHPAPGCPAGKAPRHRRQWGNFRPRRK